MIIIINNNQIRIKKYISTINSVTSKITCISINDIITSYYTPLRNNISIILISVKHQKVLNILRHSCAHLLAQALQKKYKNLKLSIGPVIKNGFYYDFFLKKKITNEDLNNIEAYMHKIVNKKIPIIKYRVKKENAKKFFKKNKYKISILKKIRENYVNCYKQSNFIDLCLGPHINNTKFIKYFKLLNISGVYWKNNKNNDTLNRIYGTVWHIKTKLNTFLTQLNNNKALDHKKIAYSQNLLCFENNSQGVVFWNKNGWLVYKNIIDYLRKKIFNNKFFEVQTPSLVGSYLFNQSGHLSKFTEYMFQYKTENQTDILKPMNCPCHINLFKNFNTKSYKDLPYRISEFGSCFRKELSGSLHGLMRLRNFIQDDGHIFCTEKHIYNEIVDFINEVKKIYFNFGFKIFKVIIAKRPENITNDYLWKNAEDILEKIITDMQIKYSTSNDGAFYGPKIEITLKDKIGRYWQCGTIQIDYFSSKRLGAIYSDNEGALKNPIILHRAALGSIERFMGILLENNVGHIPFWLCPIQFEIIYINDKYIIYAKKIYNIINKYYNTRLSITNERLEYKIKKCILEKIPYIIVLGEYEVKTRKVNIRCLSYNKYFKLSFNKFIKYIKLKKIKENYY